MHSTMEELIIKKIKGDLRGLKLGTKTLNQANVEYYLDKLAKVNEGLFFDYMTEYNKIKENLKK